MIDSIKVGCSFVVEGGSKGGYHCLIIVVLLIVVCVATEWDKSVIDIQPKHAIVVIVRGSVFIS